jgi:hypothetical protein
MIHLPNWLIVYGTDRNSGKDCSRVLEAGAVEVLYIQVWDNNLAIQVKRIFY